MKTLCSFSRAVLCPLRRALYAGALLALQPLLFSSSAAAGTPPVADLKGGPLGVERVAAVRANWFSYRSPACDRADAAPFLQIDLGKETRFDTVKLFPCVANHGWYGTPNVRMLFPVRFKIETAKDGDAAFAHAELFHDATGADCDGSNAHKVESFSKDTTARYVRLTVAKLPPAGRGKFAFQLWRFEVVAGGVEIGQHGTLSHSFKTKPQNEKRFLRPRRPDGEFAHYDHPENVTDAATWKPVVPPLSTPRGGVTVGGLLGIALERNKHYLLNGFSVSDLARDFRQRAGKPVPAKRDYLPNNNSPWLRVLGGSNAGRFMMGAGGYLRWREDAELRGRLDALVNEIEGCISPSGYAYGFPERNMLEGGEEGGYARAWFTMGLIEAGIAGNKKAFSVARRANDWFNQCPYLPEMLLHASFGCQGLIPSTRLYVETPVGKTADIQVVQRYLQLNHWLKQLIARDYKAINEYQYDRSHSYLVQPINAVFDLWLATGDEKYLEAAKGGWEIFNKYFEHTGGALAICENGGYYAPNSYSLRQCTGEFCGNAFWIYLNQQLRRISPLDEKYAAEIEKSVYNVALANQTATGDILYHAWLVAPKHSHEERERNTCCEGQGTRILGALPEFIYKTAADGLFVDLYNESAITHNGHTVQMKTRFPFDNKVTLVFEKTPATSGATNAKTPFALRLRIPNWAASEVAVNVNGSPAGTGAPGTYLTLDRQWKTGDEISFVLPMKLRLTKYAGTTPGFANAYALEYGPILLAVAGDAVSKRGQVTLPFTKDNLLKNLMPTGSDGLHYMFADSTAGGSGTGGAGDAGGGSGAASASAGALKGLKVIPYYEVQGALRDRFTCYPSLR
ncbi:MAG: glycoside hydrolase family 127 protein [Puniceicoccales bacterium]|jgi:hypothetical protein|nr:glycoside hydrolase family 127 protein [Puniceicoccales bacterium]